MCSDLVTHHSTEIDVIDHKGRIPLIWSLLSEEGVGDVRELINLQADVNHRIQGDMGTIGITACIPNIEMANKALNILLEAGENPDLHEPDGPRPLVFTMASCEPLLVRTMIRRGAVFDLPLA